MCIQANLDNAAALLDAEWVMSTCEHQGRDTVLQTGLKIHWSRRSASSCFNRVWRVTKHSAKHQSILRPWVMQHQPWPSPSAWTKTRPLHGCRNFYLLILPSLSFSLSLSLFFSLFLTGPTFVDLSCVSSRLNFAPKSTFRAKKKTPTVLSPSHHRHCRA